MRGGGTPALLWGLKMRRQKTISSYPDAFMTILLDVVRDGQDGPEFVFPLGFGGYHDVSLRTTFQSFLKAVRDESNRDPDNMYLKDAANKSYFAIVRIRNGQVIVADRRNDRIAVELRALLAERGIMDPIEREMQEAMKADEMPRENSQEKAEQVSDERNREFAKFLTRR